MPKATADKLKELSDLYTKGVGLLSDSAYAPEDFEQVITEIGGIIEAIRIRVPTDAVSASFVEVWKRYTTLSAVPPGMSVAHSVRRHLARDEQVFRASDSIGEAIKILAKPNQRIPVKRPMPAGMMGLMTTDLSQHAKTTVSWVDRVLTGHEQGAVPDAELVRLWWDVTDFMDLAASKEDREALDEVRQSIASAIPNTILGLLYG